MNPDFSKNTVETLAKRAAFTCSNPDCQVVTVGPNKDSEKATVLGEAAHIHAARPGGARFIESMTDIARGAITNGIWLCRNCHGNIDRDPSRFSHEVLFAWREDHEARARARLGSKSDQILLRLEKNSLSAFEGYPAIVRRIIIDKPVGWEWRLTAELMRHLNRDHFQRMRDLRDGLYTRLLTHVDQDDALKWVQQQTSTLGQFIYPLERILEKLNKSWGELGEPGDVEEIHHSCQLLSGALERMLEQEEKIVFTQLPKHFEPVRELLVNNVSSQAEKFAEIPKIIDEFVELVESGEIGTESKPGKMIRTIDIDLPDNWADNIKSATKKALRGETWEPDNQVQGWNRGWGIFIFVLMMILLFILVG